MKVLAKTLLRTSLFLKRRRKHLGVTQEVSLITADSIIPMQLSSEHSIWNAVRDQTVSVRITKNLERKLRPLIENINSKGFPLRTNLHAEEVNLISID